MTSDTAAIVQLRDAWINAVAARNPDALRDLLTDDYEVWAHGAPPVVGPDGAMGAMRAALDRFRIEQRFDPVETVIAGEWAFERGVESMTITPVSGGATQTMMQRALLIMRRGADGRWRYARGMTNGLPAAAPSNASTP
jgi:ketosteroid isomerase-like protein